MPPELAFEPDDRDPGARPRWDWLDLALVAGSFVGFFLPGLFASVAPVVLAHGGKMPATPPLGMLLGVMAANGLAMSGAVYGVGRLRHGYSWADLGLRRPSAGWAVASAGIGLACVPLLGYVAVLVMLAMGKKPENTQAAALAPGGLFSWEGAVGMTLLVGGFVPFGEELIFRGVLFRWLRKHWSFWPAALVSGVVFGAFHFDLAVGTAVILLGVAAAWTYERSGSLWTSVLVHSANNAVKVAALYAMLAFDIKPDGL